jgi:hypothetical protein
MVKKWVWVGAEMESQGRGALVREHGGGSSEIVHSITQLTPRSLATCVIAVELLTLF